MDTPLLPRLDRRVTLKWMAAVVASLGISRVSNGKVAGITPNGYGMNPVLLRSYSPGQLWSLTLTQAERAIVVALCDTIIPADSQSPSASAVGVPDFIDEWISAPYADGTYDNLTYFGFGRDRKLILEGIQWMDRESVARFGKSFAQLSDAQKIDICDDTCYLPKATPEFQQAARFFARFRDLVAGGFYTSPEGRKDLRYCGNTPLAKFEGPPPEVLQKLGLS